MSGVLGMRCASYRGGIKLAELGYTDPMTLNPARAANCVLDDTPKRKCTIVLDGAANH